MAPVSGTDVLATATANTANTSSATKATTYFRRDRGPVARDPLVPVAAVNFVAPSRELAPRRSSVDGTGPLRPFPSRADPFHPRHRRGKGGKRSHVGFVRVLAHG